jgi:hypothetical protein
LSFVQRRATETATVISNVNFGPVRWLPSSQVTREMTGIKDAAVSGPTVLKWAAKPAGSSRKIQVRENQRRHREKVRNYIAHLETQLENSQKQLQNAFATIGRLRAELDSAPGNGAGTVAASGYDMPMATDSHESGLQTYDSAFESRREQKEERSDKANEAQDATVNEECRKQCCGASQAEMAGHAGTLQSLTEERAPINPLLSSAIVLDLQSYTEPDKFEGKYCTMQPPSSSLSTTRCLDALRTIAENNYAGIDMATIHKRLQSGYRRPSEKQDGCRVDNQLLFALLDRITSASA